ncbi:MAG: aminotransferase class V-fold PLP-dependent enzyme [Desulfamplus sp.]|nr:aminotransferase class V-fold PLP-dependent enzyme [Desulfamplus sp.]MBF0413546.1 aminotransferase class V-fold PLP-dependent enzyme [Desulfamplus sp.]
MNNRPKQLKLVADWERLQRIFIRPEDDDCKEILVKYMEQILFGLHDFINKNVGVTEEISLKDLTANFRDTLISPEPEKKLADVISDIISQIAPKAVNVASPYFVGHMTAAIPFFMVHLKAIVAALNQNVIKLETSKVLSVLEKQVLAKIHRLIYGLNESSMTNLTLLSSISESSKTSRLNRTSRLSEDFYNTHVQNADTSLGSFTTGGTTANLTALWVARNLFFKPFKGFEGIEVEGIAQALRAYSLDNAVLLVSKRGHFSLKKSGGVLGIGNKNVIPIDVNAECRLDARKLSETIKCIKKEGRTGIISVVGVAGATETGIIDPLEDIADICQEHKINFHVDAAWGGPVMLSEKYAHKLKGIERADSVTIDGHKQFFMPMTCGMVFFRDPLAMNHIAYHSNYVNRQGSVDLGIKTLEGSREANSLILDSALKIMGTKGYALMIDHGIETARKFADEIKKRELFELITEPELNILTYRMVPSQIRKRLETVDKDEKRELNEKIDQINITLQRKQREAGRSFVSRTRMSYKTGLNGSEQDDEVVVLRSVIMNPMTNIAVLNEVLDEQEKILKSIDWINY